MKTQIQTLFLALALAHMPLAAWAQGTAFTYQGRVRSGGSDFTGNGQFKFALVTSSNANQRATATANLSGTFVTSYTVTAGGSGYLIAPTVSISGGGGSGATATANLSGGVVTSLSPGQAGSGYTSPPTVTLDAPPENIFYTTYWSNDGTSSAGSEPSDAVSVTVANGLFTVVLGDTRLANMAAISAALFAQPNLQLRIWFNDGVNGFAVLNPAQDLTPAPYAAFARNASNLLGNLASSQLSGPLPASQLSGTVSLAQLPASVVTNGASGVTINGTFTGNGAGVTNVDLAQNSGGAIRPPKGGFFLKSSPSVGINPNAVVAADVNGDDKPDLISANTGNNTLTVFTNNGSGGFVLASSPNVGSAPEGVAAADVNGDGKLDLISANYFANTLSVLTNNGSGGFVLSSSPGVGSQPWAVAVADVNGDGKIDLVSANHGASSLSVMTNNGSGGFVLSSSPTIGTLSQLVIAADVNGDGKPDLISANTGNNTLSVLTNNGSGGFVLTSSPNVGSTPEGVTAADVNGDGRLDLISANAGNNTLSVLTNNGSGGFVLSSSPGVGSTPNSVAAADVNGDGKVDLISANYFANTLSVLTNNGGGGFVLAASLGPVFGPQMVVAVDMNGDGKPDLISANNANNTLSIYMNAAEFDGLFNGIFVGTGQFDNASFGSASFGSSLSQKLNLYGTSFGIGIQNSTLYSRVAAGCAFGWYAGGVHNDGPLNNGGGTTLMVLGGGGLSVNGTFVSASDRNLKQDFSEVNSRLVLEKVAQLPIQSWVYKNDPNTKHLGPMAQDFYAAFAVGPDDKHITTVDESGVALAAIQGLNQKLEEQRAENVALKLRLEKIEYLMNKKTNRGDQ